MAKLVAKHVRKVFPPRIGGQEPVAAITDVSFEMEGHTFVSLVGPSGCGKSTFLNLVSGVEIPTAGELELVGEGSKDVRIGYVFQDPRLLPWRSVLDNILYVQDLGGRAERKAAGERVPEARRPRERGLGCIRANSAAACSSGSESRARSRSIPGCC